METLSGMDNTGRFANLLLGDLQQEFTIYSYASQPHDSGGLHFSSDVNEVKVFMKNRRGKTLCFELISKKMPNEERQVVVNSKVGFLKEAAFYNHLVPEYIKIQRDHNLDPQNIFPKCYFASESEILLDDLRQFNFIACKESLNRKQTELVLQELAIFHSTGVALKLSNPDILTTKLAIVAAPALQNESNPKKNEIDNEFRNEITKLLKSMEGFGKFADPVDKILYKIDETKLPIPSEPYATLLHNDLWNGNILFKYSLSNEPIEVKFLDFQTTIYNSPARDLVYFLLTSVNDEVLKEFTDLISLYYGAFVHNLSMLGVDIARFSYERLMIEIDIYGPTKLKHMIKLFRTRQSNGMQETNFEDEFKRIIKEFHERKWI